MDSLTRGEMRELTVRLVTPHLACVFLLAGGIVILPLHSAIAAVSFGLGVLVAVNLWIGRARPEAPRIGEDVDAESQPVLWRVVAESAEQAGSKLPKSIRLVEGIEARVVQSSRMSGLIRGRFRLEISVALFGLLDVDEFRSLLVSLFYTTSGPRARLSRAHVALRSGLASAQNRRIAKLWCRWYEPMIEPLEKVEGDLILAADRHATTVSSRGKMIACLARLHIGRAGHEMFLREYVTPLWALGMRPVNLYEGLRRFGGCEERRGQFEAVHLSLRDIDQRQDNGVTTAHRELVLESMPGDDRPDPISEPADALLTNTDAIEETISEQVSARSTGQSDLVAVEWEDFSDALASIEVMRAVQLADAAAEVDQNAPGAGSLRHSLRAASGMGRSDLAGRLLPQAKAMPPNIRPPLLESSLRSHLRAAIGSALVDHAGHRWDMNWAGQANLVGPTDDEVDLKMWVDGVLNGGAGLPALFEWFETLGVPVDA